MTNLLTRDPRHPRRRPTGLAAARIVGSALLVLLSMVIGPALQASAAVASPVVAMPLIRPAITVPSTARQVVAVGATSPGATTAKLSLWQKGTNGRWTRTVGPVPARVGSRGIGPAHEGSRYTPAGTFALDQAFGRLNNPGTKLRYFKTDPLDWWNENPLSRTYNKHIRRVNSPGGASENLYYSGTAYNLAVNIAYNPTNIPYKGSAFFLHVGTGHSTAGCVSIAQSTLTTIMRKLDPAQHPVIAIRNGTPWVP
ncbi:L,D-transpeptidase family protein [Nakamurella lactea]|uniref:L,D-transpeptidase family protein n=1 Tax=Nakamurella lactea TaxID=459515 RepID=UPI0006880AF1|nr:hypothetical protein [Nakamurella lactea]